jgi:hypothetical protein
MPVIIDGTNGITQAGEFNSDSSFGFKNRLINGQMVIDQRNAGASVTLGSGAVYNLDRWVVFSQAASKFTVQQNAGSVTPPVGFTNYLGLTVASAVSLASTDQYMLQQRIEGYNVADLGFGTANAKTVTLSFQVYSSLTGTFGGVLSNSAENRNYPFTYTISTANTWTTASVTIAGDTTGTWLTTNGVGLWLKLNLGTGATYSGTAGAWSASSYLSSVTGSVNVVSTAAATFYITGVQLEVGSTATSFDYRPYTTELNLCYRYCYALYKGDNIYYAQGGYFDSTTVKTQIQLPSTMRTTPTISYTGYSSFYRNGTLDANNVNGWTVSAANNNTAQLNSSNAMSGTAGQIGWLYSGGTSQLIFLAEL